MGWRLEFYSERTRTRAHYVVDAPTPTAALELGRRRLLTEYQPGSGARAGSLFERAQRIGGLDADGWVLYRIAKVCRGGPAIDHPWARLA
jgi:hypothetical protein